MSLVRRATALASLALPLLLAPATARAQSAADKAAAEVLFDEGVKLLASGDLAKACPKLAESLRLDTGIGTMLYLAECYERSGKTASAWAQFREAQDSAARDNDARGKIAKERADRLEPRLARLTIVVPPETETDGLVVSRDGSTLGRAVWGTAAPVDPGSHVVRATAPGRAPRELSIDIKADGARERIVIPPLEVLPSPPAGAPVAATTEPPADPTRGSTQRTLALGVGAAGLVAAGVGAVFGVRAMGTISDADARCDERTCDARGLELRSDARSQGDVATVFFVAAGVLVGAGAVLWLTAPRAAPARSASGRAFEVRPTAGATGAGLTAAVRF